MLTVEEFEKSLLHYLAQVIPNVEKVANSCNFFAREEAINFVNTNDKKAQQQSKLWQERSQIYTKVVDLLNSDPLISEEEDDARTA